MSTLSVPDRASQLVKAITGVASLLAFFSALLYYFGWVRSESQARAFGADASIFGMSSQELVIRSADALFLPTLVLLLVSVLAMWLHARLIAQAGQDSTRHRVVVVSRVLRFAWVAALVLAVVLLATSYSTGQFALPFLFAFALGGTCYARVLQNATSSVPRTMPTLLFLALAALLAISMFWMTERIARVGGEARVDAIKDDLPGTLEGVAVFSASRLHLQGPGIAETQLEDPKAAYQYRYDGAYLLQKSGGDYFLVTPGWDEGQGRLIVLPADPSIRLEYGPGR